VSISIMLYGCFRSGIEGFEPVGKMVFFKTDPFRRA
jgi:hypothetical protein